MKIQSVNPVDITNRENAIRDMKHAQYMLIEAYTNLAIALCADNDPYAVHAVMCERLRLCNVEAKFNQRYK